MTKTLVKVDQNAFPNKTVSVTPLPDLSDFVRSESWPDTISAWAELYFRIEVTTSERSRQEQRRDLRCFLAFMVGAVGDELRDHWTPRLSRAFIDTSVRSSRRTAAAVGPTAPSIGWSLTSGPSPPGSTRSAPSPPVIPPPNSKAWR